MADVTPRRLYELVDESGADPMDVSGGHWAHTDVEPVGILDPAEQGVSERSLVGAPHVLAEVVEAEQEVKHGPLGVREGRGRGGVPQHQAEAGSGEEGKEGVRPHRKGCAVHGMAWSHCAHTQGDRLVFTSMHAWCGVVLTLPINLVRSSPLKDDTGVVFRQLQAGHVALQEAGHQHTQV